MSGATYDHFDPGGNVLRGGGSQSGSPTGAQQGASGNIGYAGLSKSAAVTREQQSSIYIPPQVALPQPYSTPFLQQNFSVDPSCPFFLIYAAGPSLHLGTLGSVYMAWQATFQFKNGGSVISQKTLTWGINLNINNAANLAVYPAFCQVTVPGGAVLFDVDPAVDTTPTADQYAALLSSQGNAVANGAGQTVAPATGVAVGGAMTRWSSYCDTIGVSVNNITPYAAGAVPNPYGGTIFAGVLQQPWS